MAEEATLRIYRGDNEAGEMVDYKVPVAPGMVVLDAVHSVQAMHSGDLAVRWNCKAGKCGSCSAEVNGKPRLLCMDRMGMGYCNITKCCTEVCPEHIHITDNAIIPLKERVVDRFYDPLKKLLRVISGKKSS